MDPVLLKKTKIILDGKNGDRVLDLFYTAAYFAPGDIQNRSFSQIFPDSTELKAAVQFLQRLSLVQCSSDETSFSIPNEIRTRLRVHINSLGIEEEVLKGALSLLSGVGHVDYRHLLSVYNYAKLYPLLLGDVPVKIVFGRLRARKFHEACEFATECVSFLDKNLGEYHQSVLDLQALLARSLVAVQKREEAIAILTDVYRKSCQAWGEKEMENAMVELTRVVLEDPCSTIPSAEVRLRKIIFDGKSVAETSEASDLEKWVKFAKLICISGLTTRALSIIDDVIDRRREILGPDDDGVYDAMQAKAVCLILDTRLLEALEIQNRVFEKRKEKLGSTDLKTLSIVLDIGKVLSILGEYEKSMMMFKEVAQHTKNIDGKIHDLYSSSMLGLVMTLKLLRAFEKALELCSELYEKLVTDYGLDHILCYDCKKEMGEILIEMGKIEQARECFEELLDTAPLNEMEFLEINIQFLKNINLFNAPTRSLHWPAKEGDVPKLLSLLETGENIETKDMRGMTALHYASAFGKVQAAMTLLSKGAKYNPKTHSGASPLQLAKEAPMKMLLTTVHSFFEAVKKGDIGKVIELASKESCVLGAKDEQGCSCLHWAAQRGFKGVLGLLVELGADPEAVTDRGNSALHLAASRGHVPIAERLLLTFRGQAELTRALDGRTVSGRNTPLHAAAEKGHLAMVKTLLSHGAVFAAGNAAGKTPLQLSEDWGCRNVLKLVEELFRDVAEGDVVDTCGKLRGLESDEILAVSRARNGNHRTLVQEAVKRKNLDLAKKLVKLLKYDS